MIKLYDISKEKTDTIGFWQDKNKLYKDYIKIITVRDLCTFEYWREILFNYKEQLAIFYLKNDEAYILDKKGNEEKLNKNIRITLNKLNPSYFKKLLKEYNGFTVFKKEGYYIIDIWTK